MTPAQQALAESYIPLARRIVAPLKAAWPRDKDAFESAVMFALCEAAQSFDPGIGPKFATFARYRIWGAIRDVQRDMVQKGFKAVPGAAPVVDSLNYESEGRAVRVLMTTEDPPVGERTDATDFVDAWLRTLPPRHAAVCRSIYLDGRTQADAAREMGCSKSRLSYIHQEAVVMLADAWAYHVKKNPNVAVPVAADRPNPRT